MANNLRGLGKGLGAIFMENGDQENNEISTIKISDIQPNRSQPRKDFDEAALRELTQSIMQYGVLEPIILRSLIDGGYQIVAGERRYRASMNAGLSEIPAIVKDLSDNEVMEIALIENLQREELNPLEEAEAYASLIDSYNYSQEQVGTIVGKSRSAITNSIRLLTLPAAIKEMVKENKISSGHARALLSVSDNEEKMKKIANEIIEKDLSVRETEKLCKKKDKKTGEPKPPRQIKKDSFYSEVELALSEYLGKKVVVLPGKEKESGTLQIDFYSYSDLQDLANKLK